MLFLSEYCNHLKCDHLQVVSQKISVAADLLECLLHLKLLTLHSRSHDWVQLLTWLFCQSKFRRKFVYLLSTAEQDVVLTPFECCSHSRYVHLRVFFQRKQVAVDLVEYLLYLEFSTLHCRLYHWVQLLTWWFSQLAFWRKFASSSQSQNKM